MSDGQLTSSRGPIGPGQWQPRAMRIRQVRFVRDLGHRRPHSRRPPYAGPLSTHKTRVFLHATEAGVASISRPWVADVTRRPAAEDGSWSLNFEPCCVRKRTSRVSNVTHLPHHPTTPFSFRASPAQTHACAPEKKIGGLSRRWAPLGTVGRPGRRLARSLVLGDTRGVPCGFIDQQGGRGGPPRAPKRLFRFVL